MNKNAKRSIHFVVVGAGEGGGRIADAFAKLGYRAGAINTAQVDLDGLQAIPTTNRLHVGIGPGGAGQDMALGRDSVLAHESEVKEFLATLSSGADYLLLTAGGGGGTGSGSLPELVRMAQETGLPMAAILTIPNSYEGAQVKANAVQTLKTAHDLVLRGALRPLVLVDNERIGALFPNLTVANYWATANREIAEAWDVFNRLSTRPSVVFSAVDGMDYARVLSAGGYAAMGLSTIGGNDEQAIAHAIRTNVHGGLLANGFDLSTSRSTAAIVSGSKSSIERLPMDHLLAGFSTLQDLVGSGELFRGAYIDRGAKLRVYTLMTGLDIPAGRVQELLQTAHTEWTAYQEKLARGSSAASMFRGLDFSSGDSDRGSVFRQLAQQKKR